MTETKDLQRFIKFAPDIPRDKKTLLVGSAVYGSKTDRRYLYDDVLGVDMLDEPGVDLVVDMTETTKAINTIAQVTPPEFELIECLSVLEHCRQPWKMAETIEALLAPGGLLLLAAPFVWRVHGYPDDYFRFTRNGVKSLFPGIEWQALEYWSLGKKWKTPPKITGAKSPHLLRCEVIGLGVRK